MKIPTLDEGRRLTNLGGDGRVEFETSRAGDTGW